MGTAMLAAARKIKMLKSKVLSIFWRYFPIKSIVSNPVRYYAYQPMKKQTTTAPKVGFVSLGCAKALVDSERILTQLKVEGYEFSPGYGDADVVIVNTCGFLDSA